MILPTGQPLPARVIADLIGKPYRIGGRGPDAFDCAGLVLEVQRRLGRTIEIPETPGEKAAQYTSMLRILGQHWRSLERPEPGSVVFFETQAHVGTVLDATRFLHTEEDFGGVLIESLGSPRWWRAGRSFWVPA